MLAWSEGTDNGRQKTRNHGYDVIVGEEAIYWLLRSPSQTCHAKPKNSNQQAPDATSFFPVGGMPTAGNGLKDFSPKSRDAVALQRIREREALYLWLIVKVISVRQSTVAAISGLHCRALVMVSSSIRLTAWLQNSSGRTVREIDVWAGLTAIISALVICIIVYLSWTLLPWTTPLPTKPSATKMPENVKLANAAITDMQMRQRDVAALDAKYLKGVSWC